MKLSCKTRCHLFEVFANLKCPGCFRAEAHGGEQDKCDCRLSMDRERLMMRWE